MFYNDPINKNKLNKVTIPVDFGINSINPRDYDYTTDIAGNIQDAKGCSSTIDYTELLYFTGNNRNTILLDMCFESYQSDGSEIPPENSIRFIPNQKSFKNYHIKTAYQSDMLIIPFDFTIQSIPTNRTYPTCYLIIFLDVLRCPFDHWPVMVNANKPLTFDHIQMTSKNDKKGISLIYAPTFDKQFHSLSMTNHSLSIIFNHFFMFRNDKFYLHILSIYKYIKSSICIYNISAFMDLKKHVVQGVQRGIPFGCICIYNKLRTYICTYTK
jgi:hypothetical protein